LQTLSPRPIEERPAMPRKPGSWRPLGHASSENQRPTKLDGMSPEFKRTLELVGKKASEKFSNGRAAFRFFDSDHDGVVSRGEVRHFFRFFNMPKEKSDEFFDELSPDGDDIEYTNFVSLLWPYIVPGVVEPVLSSMHELGDREKVAAPGAMHADVKRLAKTIKTIERKLEEKFKGAQGAFRGIDFNRDGVVSREELRQFFHIYGYEPGDADQLYDFLDTQGQGNVHYSDFAKIFDAWDGHHKNHGIAAPISVAVGRADPEVADIMKMAREGLLGKFSSAVAAVRFLEGAASLSSARTGHFCFHDLHMLFRMLNLPPEAARKVWPLFGKGVDDFASREDFIEVFGRW